MPGRWREVAHGQRGGALALAVLCLPALVALLLLVAEVGRVLVLRQQLTDVAEAAALAAVRQLDPGARKAGHLRLEALAAEQAARQLVRANAPGVSETSQLEVAVDVRQPIGTLPIGADSHGGRSVAGQEQAPAVCVTLRRPGVRLWAPRAVSLQVVGCAGLRPLAIASGG